jgi:hypothetical protein
MAGYCTEAASSRTSDRSSTVAEPGVELMKGLAANAGARQLRDSRAKGGRAKYGMIAGGKSVWTLAG